MKKFLGVLILGLIFCTKTFSADVAGQLLKLEDMYQQGSITEEKFLKAKSILLKIDLTNKEKIEHAINRKLNETDWKVLNLLLENPVITNKEIAEKVFMSVDGIGSSLRRMYEYFNIKESKYKKISLLLEGIKISNNSSTAT